ncbi:MAG: tetratricopeptide repeat protein [Telluria sp.]
MTARALMWLCTAAALALGGAARAQAQADPPAPQLPPGVQQDLYMDALQSIAEGRREDASGTLRRLVEQAPLNAGAWLELALLQCGLGRATEAERMFAIIETRFNPSRDILDIINHQRDEGCHPAAPYVATSLTLARGSDRNVNQGASNPNYTVDKDGVPTELPLLPEFLPKADRYTQLSGEYARELGENGLLGVVQFQGRANDHLSAYNSSSLFAGVQSPWRLQRWSVRASGMLGGFWLGGQLYQRQAQVQMRVGPPLPLPPSLQFATVAALTHNEYLTLTNFNSNMVELRGVLNYQQPSWAASASLGVLYDSARAHRPGGDRRGGYANVQWRTSLSYGLVAEAAYSLQTWRSQSAYAPGIIDQVRSQQTHVLRAALSWPLSKSQQVQLEVRGIHDHENISIFQYNNRQLQLSWQWQGP